MLFVYIGLLGLFIAFLGYLMVREREGNAINFKGEELKDMNVKELYDLGEELSKNEDLGCCNKKKNTLIESVKKTYKNIVKNHHYLESLYKNNVKLSGGAQWLLDNIYLIEKEYKNVILNMPNKYYHNLPCRDNGIARIYIICSTLFNNSHGNLTKEGVKSFIDGFTKNTSLTLGELWAIPLIMRVIILERIRFISEEVCNLEKERINGENLSRYIIVALKEEEIKEEIDRFKRRDEKFTYTMAESFLRVIKDSGIENEEVYSAVEGKLGIKRGELYKVISNVKTEEIKFERELGNDINSLRFIDGFNWKNFVESISAVDKILRKDPSNTYVNMDFETRDYYRHKIEELSKRSKVSEEKISTILINLATSKKGRESHIGYYLIGEGKDDLYSEINIKKSFMERASLKQKLRLYRLSILAMMVLIGTFLVLFLKDEGRGLGSFILLKVLLIIPISYIGKTFINVLFLTFIKPHYISKLSMNEGIDKENATLVVVPTILNSVERTKKLMKDLEIYYLSNREKNIYFALCSDFEDNHSETLEGDSEIINTGLNVARSLNDKYGDKFLFLHRKRVFNERDKIYMGWERKRGKILELNKLLRGENNTTYEYGTEFIKSLPKIKYVITLDSDTKVPIGTFKRLIGAMAHPLNYNYGIMQPKIVVDLENAYATEFSKHYVMDKGINMYSSLSSEIYEDLFNQGTFTGKGIYSVDKFLETLDNKVKENTMLSHDLIEGELLKTAFLSDTPLVDGFPIYYHSYAMRNHRWIRGDVQNIPWAFRKEIKALSRYKILDNIRMALVYPSILISILVALFVKPFYLEGFIAFSLFSILTPLIVNIFNLKNYGVIKKFKQCFLMFTFFIHESYLSLNAIIKSSYRMIISKKKLLEWQSAFYVENSGKNKLGDYIKLMYPSLVITLAIAYLCYRDSLSLLYFMLIPITLWLLSPFIAYGLSSEGENNRLQHVEKEDEEYLRKLSRRVWAYFEDFVNEENNNLGPDNYQGDPMKGIAHRTSPTNIAMTISSNSCAYDLGYIGIYSYTYRLRKTLHALENLETLNGHFYNWYDTLTLKPLEPKYISTVDSGNLLSYIWLTEKTIEEYMKNPFINSNYKKGLEDTLNLAMEELSLSGYFESFKEELNRNLSLCEYKQLLMDIRSRCKEVEKIEGKTYWVDKLRVNATTYIKELQIIAPWTDLCSIKNSLLSRSLKSALLKTPLKDIVDEINRIIEDNKEELSYNSELRILIKRGVKSLEKLKIDINDILDRLKIIGDNMDFSMLYNKERGLFSIGYDVNNKTLNNSYYDLMASEARVASYVAITKGDIKEDNWWNLGRTLTPMGRGRGLLSWSGTMFEYLMPLIILKNYEGSLWDETYKGVVEEQIYYGEVKKIPWGISESGYFHFDNSMIYQYRAFGIPKAGLKRGLEDDTVISPYSTIMALMVDYKKAIKNLKNLEENKALGLYGFYEALDYTKDRVAKGKDFSIIKSFMIHHEGMSLMSIVNVLNKNIFRERFHRKEEVISGELLLQENTYKDITFYKERVKEEKVHHKELPEIIVRNYNTGVTEFPESVVLSNGSYHTMITNSGSGFSKVKDMNLYRWSKDYINDNKGMFIYLRDMSSSEYWSATFQPTKVEVDEYNVDFTLHKAEFKSKYRGIDTELSVAVSNEENMEIRTLTIDNNTKEDRIIEITTYLEVTLNTHEGDISHKAFSNLFIRTESFEDNVLLAHRRPRAKGQKKPYIFQKMLFQGEKIGGIEYETSRLNFIGRGNDEDNPRVMKREIPLENSEGTVIDPIFSQRIRIKIPKGEKGKIYILMGTSDTKEDAINICNKYSSLDICRGIFNEAHNNSLGELSYIGLKYKQASLYQMLCSRILYTNKDIRRRETYIKSLSKHQKDLWSFGVSGDLPIVTLNIKDSTHLDIVRQCVQCYEYLNRRGVEFDLLIINEEGFSYNMPLQGEVSKVINKYSSMDNERLRGKVFLQSYDNLKEEGISFIKAISTLYIDGKEEDAFFSLLFKGEDNLTYNLRGLPKEVYKNSPIKRDNTREIPLRWKREKYMAEIGEELWGKDENGNNNTPTGYDTGRLKFFNGFGGFNEKDHYVMVLKNNNNTPAPWINVISNKNFGFHISESGSSYTWYKNSRENKLTPWNNDFISDTLGEALFLRDEDSGEVFSVTPKPLRDKEEYIIEHGFGFSKFIHSSNNIKGELTWFTPLDNSLKVGIVKLKNFQGNKRRISLTYYSNLILGVNEEGVHKTISTYYDEEGEFIYGKNPYSEKFGDTNCYLKIIGGEDISYCGDREDFIGRGRNLDLSLSMENEKLSNKVGAGFDSILSYRTSVDIEENEEKIITIIMGADERIENIRTLLKEYSSMDFLLNKLEEVENHWIRVLGTFKVKTPDESLNILTNGWLLYQVISCRYYSRTAFYQCGGAYGYRDQLQDVLSIGLVDSSITRKQIKLNASRQYEEGDVQHWWHPVVDSGIRTRFSDDLLWLPYSVIDYINNTGDYSILKEEEYYLKDSPLNKGEDERYSLTNYSDKKGTIYEHCIKAIDRSLNLGEHGIPLMGCGDWNDGMSTVGNKGDGESVWLGWFLSYILKYFSDICKSMGEEERGEKYLKFREEILNNIEENAWDGAWYKRAYFDDGTPLGSIENEECSIDSLPQSWSIIAEGSNRERQIKAMKSVEDYLVNQLNGMILLLAPPFDSSKLEPGYIKGYVPGVRENGGQYTHAALWVIMAIAKLGNIDKALELLQMINPINHTLTSMDCEKYKVEPYVIAADIYIKEPHGGRGGWSWYTGAASWTYKIILQSILGLKLIKGEGFTINVNMPSGWNEYSIVYKKNQDEIYNITVVRGEEKGIYVDNKILQQDIIYFSKGIHEVKIII